MANSRVTKGEVGGGGGVKGKEWIRQRGNTEAQLNVVCGTLLAINYINHVFKDTPEHVEEESSVRSSRGAKKEGKGESKKKIRMKLLFA